MFTVQPDEVDRLDGTQLVELLRMLVHAEARCFGVPLRDVDVPLQVNIPDGGEDGRVKWEGGEPSTPFLPCRDVVFQSKATDHGGSQWRNEVWTKGSQTRTVVEKELNPAIAAAIERGAAYVGITGSPRVTARIAEREQAIRDGIAQAGGDPARLASIRIYDGNKLAAWASSHPAVALWVREREAGIPLAAFATMSKWSRRSELANPPFVASPDREFSLGPTGDDRLKSAQLGARVLEHLIEPRACVRIWGASGIGKTRALYEALAGYPGLLLDVSAANLIFCDYRETADQVFAVAHHLKNARADAILVVDSCPLPEARTLFDLAREADSRLRVVTIGVDGRDRAEDCLMIRALPADAATIGGILTAALPRVRREEIEFLAAQCAGYPGIAVLASAAYRDSRGVRQSADEVAGQILRAAGAGADTVRALECLAMFDGLEPDVDPRGFDALCETLVHMKGELVFEHLVRASHLHLVDRIRGRMTMPMSPTANFLATRRLGYLRPSTVAGFLDNSSPDRRDAMLARWQALGGRSPTVLEVVRSKIRRDWMQNDDVLAADASPYLVAFTHVDPDTVMTALSSAVRSRTLEDLARVEAEGALLDALRLLASRDRTFPFATPLVLRLAAASDFGADTPVVRLLRQPYQVALAGTAASGQNRRLVLAEALDDEDPRMKRASVEALGAMLTTRMSRQDPYEQVAEEPFRAEWRPTDPDQILEYFRWALGKLLVVWRSHPELRARIGHMVGGELRLLVAFDVLPLIEDFVRTIVAEDGHWSEGTRGIGDWLYYDRPSEIDEHAVAVRALYELTLPSDPVGQVLLYSRYWGTDINDPDVRYGDVGDAPDFDYTARRVDALAPVIAANKDLLERAIRIMATTDTNAPFAFAHALAGHLDDPLAAFSRAIGALDGSESRAGLGFVTALLSSLDHELAGDPPRNERLIATARGSRVLAEDEMTIYTSLRMTDARVAEIAAAVREGRVDVHRVVPISYGRRLDDASMPVLADLIRALVDRTGHSGAWAALEILNMFVHGRKDVPPEVLDLIKLAMLSPAIVDGPIGPAGHAEHVMERLMKLLLEARAVDDAFARGFVQLIERSCRSSGVPVRPTDALRNSLALVVRQAPREAWAVLSAFYETATRAERERLGRIVGATRPFAFDATRTAAGFLFEAPEPAILSWVERDPDDRLGFVLGFYPILERQDGDWIWHPALWTLAGRYGDLVAFRKGLRQRILPSAYGGSLEEHLRSFRMPLASLEPHPKLGEWSERLLGEVGRWLEYEAERS